MIESATGAKFDQVLFDGSAPANVALVGHHIDAHAPSLGDFASYIKDGTVRLLAVAADERDPRFPDTPTFKEEGVDISYSLFRGVWAPIGISDETRAAIEKLVLEAADSEEFQATLKELSVRPGLDGPRRVPGRGQQPGHVAREDDAGSGNDQVGLAGPPPARLHAAPCSRAAPSAGPFGAHRDRGVDPPTRRP